MNVADFACICARRDLLQYCTESQLTSIVNDNTTSDLDSEGSVSSVTSTTEIVFGTLHN
jgi:hypothetical protein